MISKSKPHDLARLLEEMLTEIAGPLTAAERRQAEVALGVQKPNAKRRPKRGP